VVGRLGVRVSTQRVAGSKLGGTNFFSEITITGGNETAGKSRLLLPAVDYRRLSFPDGRFDGGRFFAFIPPVILFPAVLGLFPAVF